MLPPSNGRQLYKKGQNRKGKGGDQQKQTGIIKMEKLKNFLYHGKGEAKMSRRKNQRCKKDGEKLGIDTDPAIMRRYVARITADTATKNHAMALMGSSMVTAT